MVYLGTLPGYQITLEPPGESTLMPLRADEDIATLSGVRGCCLLLIFSCGSNGKSDIWMIRAQRRYVCLSVIGQAVVIPFKIV